MKSEGIQDQTKVVGIHIGHTEVFTGKLFDLPIQQSLGQAASGYAISPEERLARVGRERQLDFVLYDTHHRQGNEANEEMRLNVFRRVNVNRAGIQGSLHLSELVFNAGEPTRR